MMKNVKISDMDENGLLTSFSSTRRQILLLLKQKGQLSLIDLSKELKITKMGVLINIHKLEELDIIERFKERGGVGRPRVSFRLTSNSKDIFPKAYSSITNSILEFVEEKLGRSAVYEALKKRQVGLAGDYKSELDGLDFENKVKTLAKIRDQEGYMVELKMVPSGDSYELLEYNCPILNVADKYWEACTVERELFEEILGAEVTTTHRTVAGDSVCRFLLKKHN